MKKFMWIIVTLVVLAALAVPAAMVTVQASSIPTFSIVSVITDQKVTIQTDSFPAGRTFNVLMGAMGTKGIGGTQVATTGSGAGGAFQATYTIPASLKGAARIAIRLESTTGGFFAFNWFWNNTSTGGSVTPGFTGIPTFSIESVVVDSKVTIKTNNFPANRDFNVLMGNIGTKGIGGTQVATTNSSTGGVFVVTYDIPAGLKGKQRIAIRLESTTGGFFAFNWFWNNTSTSGTVTPVVVTIPTFSISAVTRNTSVTIKGVNFPASKDFKVFMGPFGTLGIGGTYVTTVSTGSGGNLNATFTIPSGLSGSQRIAIRMESTSGGYFAYNWFWNNTTP